MSSGNILRQKDLSLDSRGVSHRTKKPMAWCISTLHCAKGSPQHFSSAKVYGVYRDTLSYNENVINKLFAAVCSLTVNAINNARVIVHMAASSAVSQ